MQKEKEAKALLNDGEESIICTSKPIVRLSSRLKYDKVETPRMRQGWRLHTENCKTGEKRLPLPSSLNNRNFVSDSHDAASKNCLMQRCKDTMHQTEGQSR